ncbi:hypothetical protein [Streptomyces sp.]|uniref:hypothetical protein n=1 Tax=Streptomyces sp. TaxID=1931 RepID=UPI002D785EDE|nr:hypothetical protein [Streptomyces sp.]HET6353450.1 hypothetical protein [Streptomyces sp.]
MTQQLFQVGGEAGRVGGEAVETVQWLGGAGHIAVDFGVAPLVGVADELPDVGGGRGAEGRIPGQQSGGLVA